MLFSAPVRRRSRQTTDRKVRLPDGARVIIRPIREEDASAFAHAYTRLSPESLRRRHLTAAYHLSPRDLRYLTAVDQHEHVALVALEPASGDILGSARYFQLPSAMGTAEMAVEVIDEWQRRGVGRALLGALSAHARANRLTRFTALVAADNLPMQQALKRAALAVEEDYGELEYLLDVDALALPCAPSRRAVQRRRATPQQRRPPTPASRRRPAQLDWLQRVSLYVRARPAWL